MPGSELSPYVIALGIMLALLLGYRLVTGSWAVWRVVNGSDGRPSTEITFVCPTVQPNGSPWPPGASIVIGVTVEGRAGAGTATFSLTAP